MVPFVLNLPLVLACQQAPDIFLFASLLFLFVIEFGADSPVDHLVVLFLLFPRLLLPDGVGLLLGDVVGQGIVQDVLLDDFQVRIIVLRFHIILLDEGGGIIARDLFSVLPS